MNITITLDLKNYGYEAQNVMLDANQNIYESLKVIIESLNLKIEFNNIKFIKSLRQRRLISSYSTYKIEKIYTGDILKIL